MGGRLPLFWLVGVRRCGIFFEVFLLCFLLDIWSTHRSVSSSFFSILIIYISLLPHVLHDAKHVIAGVRSPNLRIALAALHHSHRYPHPSIASFSQL